MSSPRASLIWCPYLPVGEMNFSGLAQIHTLSHVARERETDTGKEKERYGGPCGRTQKAEVIENARDWARER